jgi:hypothetical protein
MNQLAGKLEVLEPQSQIDRLKELVREVFNNIDLDDEYWAEWRHRAWEVLNG